MRITSAPSTVAGIMPLRSLSAVLLMFLTLFTLARPVLARPAPATRLVDAVGIAVIEDGREAAARDAAIADALRKALEQAVGTFVSSETMVENYEVLSDTVYTRTQGFVTGYTITNESSSPGVYRVAVRAEVSSGAVKDRLDAMGLLQAKVENPRILFMIAEKNIGQKRYVYWWWGETEFMGETVDISAAETALQEFFINRGFNVVDISGSAWTFEISDAFKVADLTRDGARSVGKELNADIVVYGKAIATQGPSTPGSALGLYIADITAQAVRVDDGVVLGASSGHGISRNISVITGGMEAISNASTELGGRLTEQITAKWSGPLSVTLRLSGVTDYKELADFKRRLKGRVRGIDAVYQRSFSGGVAVLELETSVSAQTIADDISTLAPTFRVTNTSQNSVDVFVEGDDLNR
ncbi:MAG: hypothetical protein BMS9Abin24_224 [Thermodesulfobacteriota bacterium]|nr:MAG: hypothetical protein BMS9Abin24_224 [Thermodesulfobacteriota bacterium]